MNKERTIFNFTNGFFWLILTVLFFLAFPFINGLIFNDKPVRNWLLLFEAHPVDSTLVYVDSTQLERKDSLRNDFRQITWRWKDFDQDSFRIDFKVSNADYLKAQGFREDYIFYGNDKSLYLDLIEASKVPLDSMEAAFRKNLDRLNLSGIAAMNHVVTAIQTPPYTRINGPEDRDCPFMEWGSLWLDECRPVLNRWGKGCCNRVAPFGIFSPAEFIWQRTGDCDTKAVIAFALLKRLGFDVAVITGMVASGGGIGYHAMLAVANVHPLLRSKHVVYNGMIYYPWEVTDFDNDYVLGNMTMWQGWNKWVVSCN